MLESSSLFQYDCLFLDGLEPSIRLNFSINRYLIVDSSVSAVYLCIYHASIIYPVCFANLVHTGCFLFRIGNIQGRASY